MKYKRSKFMFVEKAGIIKREKNLLIRVYVKLVLVL